MNKPLATLLVLTSLALGAGTAFAQETGGAPDRGAECHHGRGGRMGRGFTAEGMERRITHMTARLSLDTHQVALVREIFTSARTQAEALRAQAPSAERHAAFEALRTATEGRIDAILNDTQRAQLATMRAERQAHMREHGGGRGHHRGGGPGPRSDADRGI